MRNQELHPRTAVINRKQKNSSKNARQEALLWLTAHFPKAFDNTLSIQPLKIGIMEDILHYTEQAAAHGISKSKLREAVVLYTRRIDYLTCLKAKEMRVDLEGNPVALVTEEDAAKASAKIKKRVEKSAKNARKTPSAQKPLYSSPASPKNNASSQENTDLTAYYTDKPALYGAPHTAQQSPRTASVVIKHKTARQFDPDAVARLKEKLGLARQLEEQE